jgi:hypothetical protein
MIPVTNEPMEGEIFDVQDHARWTGTSWTSTHGEMISSDLHGAEEHVVVLIHTCKREQSPAHLVCPWRHNA